MSNEFEYMKPFIPDGNAVLRSFPSDANVKSVIAADIIADPYSSKDVEVTLIEIVNVIVPRITFMTPEQALSYRLPDESDEEYNDRAAYLTHLVQAKRVKNPSKKEAKNIRDAVIDLANKGYTKRKETKRSRDKLIEYANKEYTKAIAALRVEYR